MAEQKEDKQMDGVKPVEAPLDQLALGSALAVLAEQQRDGKEDAEL